VFVLPVTRETVEKVQNEQTARYRGRLAPSPTGWLHLGHARTFWLAQERARAACGTLVLRSEDLDRERCSPEFGNGMLEDLRWFGFEWQEGPDIGGPFGPYTQSERSGRYEAAFQQLQAAGLVYPCICSRGDVLRALSAPHLGEEEPVYPGTCRSRAEEKGRGSRHRQAGEFSQPGIEVGSGHRKVNWRFRVPDGEQVRFADGRLGPQEFVAGKDFGDFVVWRYDQTPSYQLAVVVDDAAMAITEVVRGEDLLISTARQLLLYRAFGWTPPQFYHCALVRDEVGVRLAKRSDAFGLRTLRQLGRTPADLRAGWQSITVGE
jgi:glutamyl/glutaminyl-tRNA synthetase